MSVEYHRKEAKDTLAQAYKPTNDEFRTLCVLMSIAHTLIANAEENQGFTL